jgi:hypothetical protein
MQGEIPLIGLDIWSGANIVGLEPVCNPMIDAMWSGHLWNWNTQNHPENGDFSMSVRFTKENGQWKMYVASLSADIGEKYELEKGQIGSGTMTGDHATLTLPIDGYGYAEVHFTLNSPQTQPSTRRAYFRNRGTRTAETRSPWSAKGATGTTRSGPNSAARSTRGPGKQFLKRWS